MKTILLTTAAVVIAATAAGAQATTTADFRWEKTLPAGSRVRLHNLNGDVTVTVGTGDKVEIVGIKRGSAGARDDVTIEVVETSDGIVACSIFRNADMYCDEDGMHSDRGRRRRGRDWEDNASIHMQVRVPRSMIVSAGSVSGDVSATGLEGDVRVSSVSGNVRATQLRASRVEATSVSGDVVVGIDALTGNGDLEFTSVSGNVTVTLPRGVGADLRMHSVSGELDSDFPLTLTGRTRRSNIEARIGSGGRRIEVSTVSGDVRLRSAAQ